MTIVSWDYNGHDHQSIPKDRDPDFDILRHGFGGQCDIESTFATYLIDENR